jgi:hypothetical protein
MCINLDISKLTRISWKRDIVATLENNGFKNSKLHCIEYDITMARFWNDV